MARRNSGQTAFTVCLALIAFAATACGTSSSPDPSGAKTVIATTDVWGSVAKAIAGDHTEVRSILNSAVDDPHSYEATPSDAAAITDATLVVYNGGHYDQWADDILDAHEDVTTVDAYSLTPQQADGQPANEHVFYDLATAKAVAGSIADHLAIDDPANAAAYRANAAAFGTQTDAIAESEREIGRKHPGAAVVATEPVAHYLLAAAGITDRTPESFASAVEEGDDPAPVDVAAMLDLINGRRGLGRRGQQADRDCRHEPDSGRRAQGGGSDHRGHRDASGQPRLSGLASQDGRGVRQPVGPRPRGGAMMSTRGV